MKKKAPKRFHNLPLTKGDNPETIEMRITFAEHEKIEQKTGKTLQEFLQDMAENTWSSFVTIFWAGRQPFMIGDGKDNKFTYDDAQELFDDLTDEGFTMLELNDAIMKILSVSGLIPSEEELEELKKKQKEEEQQALANAQVGNEEKN